jgi:hypothetical protein
MSSSRKHGIRAGKSARGARRSSRAAWFEVLEDRVVLSFGPLVSYNVGTQTTLGENGFAPQVVTGEFTDDGKLDLVVSNTADGTISYLAGKGDGTFSPAVTISTGLGANNVIWLAAADFNDDGKLDIAVEGNTGIAVLLGNGNGTFQAPEIYTPTVETRGGLAVGDFFGNGRQDIAMAAFETNEVEILPNNGNGTFGTPVYLPMPSSFSAIRSVATGNIFGNGHADLVVAGGLGTNNVDSTTDPAGIGLFENDGKGDFTFTDQFNAVTTSDPGGGDGEGDTVNPEHVNVADLRGDGKTDVVLSLYDHNIDVFLNNGNGTFQPGVGYTTETPGSVGGYPRGVTFADINNDGKMDIITDNFGEPTPVDQTTTEPGSISVLYGNGDGTFQTPIQYTPYTFPGGLAVGDFNGDGLPDLAVTQNYTGHTVGVLLNQPDTANEPPTVTGLSPASGPAAGGTVVTITGTNFTGTTQVDFGKVAASSFKVLSNTSITATAPSEAAGVVNVAVYNAGASALSSADKYTFLPTSEGPSVTGVTPAVGPTYGGNSVTIVGTNFTGATIVRFGTVSALSFTVSSATTIIATAPAEGAGLVNVTVTSPSGTSPVVTADDYTYQSPVVYTITVSPSTASLIDGATQLFVATAFDQFGKSLATQPAFTWSLSGLGTVTSVGLYTAPASGSGTTTVEASSEGRSGTAKATYGPLTSEIWTGLGTSNNWSDALNWSSKLVPTSATTVIFNNTSLKNSVVDPNFAGTVGAVQITTEYSGTVSLSRNLTVYGTFVEGDGVYNTNGFGTTVGGLASLYGGYYLASTEQQAFMSGLAVLGGRFVGSTGTVSTTFVTLSSGYLIAPSTTLYIAGGNFTYTGGTFNAEGGTVDYVGTNLSPTLSMGTSGAVRFFNFTDYLADTYPSGMTITGTLTVTGTFGWKMTGSVINGNIEAQGNVDDENHGGIGNPYLTLDGTANQVIEDLSGIGGGQFRTITINKAGGTVSLACDPIVFSGLSLIAGAVNTGSYYWMVAGPFSANAGLNLGNVAIDGTNVTVSGTNVQVANLVFMAAADKLTATSGNLSVTGIWYDGAGAAFVANGGTVTFDGTGGQQQLTSGGQSFYNIIIVAGSSVILEADLTVTGSISGFGTLNLNGHRLFF